MMVSTSWLGCCPPNGGQGMDLAHERPEYILPRGARTGPQQASPITALASLSERRFLSAPVETDVCEVLHTLSEKPSIISPTE